jgi:glycosyltransferase involved in cell wall biosynthesis
LIAERIEDIKRFMYRDHKIIVVMPAYNAAKTLRKTYDEVMEQGIVDLVILVDDASCDETSAVASSLPHTKVFVHERNKVTAATRRHATGKHLRRGRTS